MADNDEAGGSHIQDEDPMQAFIENELRNTFKSMFPTVREFVGTWMKGGQVGPPPMIGYGCGNSITNLVPILPNHGTPEDAPVNKPKKARKRYKKTKLDDSTVPPEQGTDSRFVDRIPIKDWHKMHHLGRSILPADRVKQLRGHLLDLHEVVLVVERKLLDQEAPTYPLFIANVPERLGFVRENGADLLFVRFDDIFAVYHSLPLHPSIVRLVALQMAHQIKMENTPGIVMVDPYYMQEMFVNNPEGRKSATGYLQKLFLDNASSPPCSFLLPYFPE
jgi:hypothetical protein